MARKFRLEPGYYASMFCPTGGNYEYQYLVFEWTQRDNAAVNRVRGLFQDKYWGQLGNWWTVRVGSSGNPRCVVTKVLPERLWRADDFVVPVRPRLAETLLKLPWDDTVYAPIGTECMYLSVGADAVYIGGFEKYTGVQRESLDLEERK